MKDSTETDLLGMIVVTTIDCQTALHNLQYLLNFIVNFSYCDFFPFLHHDNFHLSHSGDAFRGLASVSSSIENDPNAINSIGIW